MSEWSCGSEPDSELESEPDAALDRAPGQDMGPDPDTAPDPDGDSGGAMLEVLAEFSNLYRQRLDRIQRYPNSPHFQEERARLLQDWVDELTRQNTTLVNTVQQLEAEASRRCAMLEGRLVATASCTKQQMLQLRQLQLQAQQLMTGRLEAESRAADMTSLIQQLTEGALQLDRFREPKGRLTPQGGGEPQRSTSPRQLLAPTSPHHRLVAPTSAHQLVMSGSPHQLPPPSPHGLQCCHPSEKKGDSVERSAAGNSLLHQQLPEIVPSRGQADGDSSAHVHQLQAELRSSLHQQQSLSESLHNRDCELRESRQQISRLKSELERFRRRPASPASIPEKGGEAPAAVHRDRLERRCRHLQQQRNRALAQLARIKVLHMQPELAQTDLQSALNSCDGEVTPEYSDGSAADSDMGTDALLADSRPEAQPKISGEAAQAQSPENGVVEGTAMRAETRPLQQAIPVRPDLCSGPVSEESRHGRLESAEEASRLTAPHPEPTAAVREPVTTDGAEPAKSATGNTETKEEAPMTQEESETGCLKTGQPVTGEQCLETGVSAVADVEPTSRQLEAERPAAAPVEASPRPQEPWTMVHRQMSVRTDLHDRDEMEARTQLVIELQHHLAVARDEVALRDTAISRLEQKLTTARDQLTALTERLANEAQERSLITEQKRDLTEQASDLSARLEASSESCSRLESEAEARCAQICHLEESLAQTEARATQLMEQCAHRDVEIGRQWTTIASLQEALQETKAQLAAYSGRSLFASLLGGGAGTSDGDTCSGDEAASVSTDAADTSVAIMFQPLQDELQHLVTCIMQTSAAHTRAVSMPDQQIAKEEQRDAESVEEVAWQKTEGAEQHQRAEEVARQKAERALSDAREQLDALILEKLKQQYLIRELQVSLATTPPPSTTASEQTATISAAMEAESPAHAQLGEDHVSPTEGERTGSVEPVQKVTPATASIAQASKSTEDAKSSLAESVPGVNQPSVTDNYNLSSDGTTSTAEESHMTGPQNSDLKPPINEDIPPPSDLDSLSGVVPTATDDESQAPELAMVESLSADNVSTAEEDLSGFKNTPLTGEILEAMMSDFTSSSEDLPASPSTPGTTEYDTPASEDTHAFESTLDSTWDTAPASKFSPEADTAISSQLGSDDDAHWTSEDEQASGVSTERILETEAMSSDPSELDNKPPCSTARLTSEKSVSVNLKPEKEMLPSARVGPDTESPTFEQTPDTEPLPANLTPQKEASITGQMLSEESLTAEKEANISTPLTPIGHQSETENQVNHEGEEKSPSPLRRTDHQLHVSDEGRLPYAEKEEMSLVKQPPTSEEGGQTTIGTEETPFAPLASGKDKVIVAPLAPVGQRLQPNQQTYINSQLTVVKEETSSAQLISPGQPSAKDGELEPSKAESLSAHLAPFNQLAPEKEKTSAGLLTPCGQLSEDNQLAPLTPSSRLSGDGRLTTHGPLSDGGQLTPCHQLSEGGQLTRLTPCGQLSGDDQLTPCGQLSEDGQLTPDDQLVDHLADQLAAERCRCQELSEQLEALRAEHACCLELRETLETRQAQAADNQARLASQLSDAYQQLGDTRQQLSDAREQLGETRSRLAETLCGQEEVHAQADVIVAHVAGWMAEWKAENQRLEATVIRQAETIAALRAENRMLSGRLDSLSSQSYSWDRRLWAQGQEAAAFARFPGPDAAGGATPPESLLRGARAPPPEGQTARRAAQQQESSPEVEEQEQQAQAQGGLWPGGTTGAAAGASADWPSYQPGGARSRTNPTAELHNMVSHMHHRRQPSLSQLRFTDVDTGQRLIGTD